MAPPSVDGRLRPCRMMRTATTWACTCARRRTYTDRRGAQRDRGVRLAPPGAAGQSESELTARVRPHLNTQRRGTGGEEGHGGGCSGDGDGRRRRRAQLHDCDQRAGSMVQMSFEIDQATGQITTAIVRLNYETPTGTGGTAGNNTYVASPSRSGRRTPPAAKPVEPATPTRP